MDRSKTKIFSKLRDFFFQKHNYRQIAHVANRSKTFLTKLEDAEVTEILQWTAEGIRDFLNIF
jgi:hypothetical protein